MPRYEIKYMTVQEDPTEHEKRKGHYRERIKELVLDALFLNNCETLKDYEKHKKSVMTLLCVWINSDKLRHDTIMELTDRPDALLESNALRNREFESWKEVKRAFALAAMYEDMLQVLGEHLATLRAE